MNELELSHFLVTAGALLATLTPLFVFGSNIKTFIIKGLVSSEDLILKLDELDELEDLILKLDELEDLILKLDELDDKMAALTRKECGKVGEYVQVVDGKTQKNLEKLAELKGRVDGIS